VREHYLKSLKINYVENVREVLDLALLNEKVRQPIEFIIPEDRPNIV
jgi:ATP-dependent Lon protease